MLLITYKCNLHCSYCYEPKNQNFKMSVSKAKQLISEYLNSFGKTSPVEIQFMGGEPLLEFSLIKEVSEWLWDNGFDKGDNMLFAPTNGTLLNDEMREFALGLSFDGDQVMQNTNRSDSYHKVDLKFFAATWPEQSVKMTISPSTVGHLAEGVKFLHSSRSYYFSTNFSDLKVNDRVVVETVRGKELGWISIEPIEMEKYSSPLELAPILRKATEKDISWFEKNIKDAEQAFQIFNIESKKMNLDMRLIYAEYTLDKTKITFTYSADERVDFRELLKVLAARLRTRIDLRQIGARDKAKMIGGIGVCGLPICCSTFLNEFDGISINRAKNQMLAINIPKLSGHCGKLICCLKFESFN